MPVVPFSAAAGGSKPKQRGPITIPVAEEPWLLMAAAQMDAQGRLIAKEEEPNDGPTRRG
jgi:hypothetical protein